MTPMIPDPITLDLGTQTMPFGWTMDPSIVLVLVVLLIPWIVLGVATVAELIEPLMRAPEAPASAVLELPEAA